MEHNKKNPPKNPKDCLQKADPDLTKSEAML